MKDARVTVFRKTLQGLIESLDATVRVTRWPGAEVAPGPLQESASQLVTRLGSAGRLRSATFSGTVGDVARVNEMKSSMLRLDSAYVAYRQQIERRPGERESASATLVAEIDAVKTASGWVS